MLSQHWIVKGNSRVLAVQHWPDVPIPMGAVIALPGFSHAMCDMDYFMSRLARHLCKRGFFVVQADLRGHGDGAGEFKDVDLSTLEEDIRLVIDHYANTISDQLFCIGRGLMATLLAAFATDAYITGIAGIGPYCVAPEIPQAFAARMKDGTFDAYDAFPGNDYAGFSDFEDNALCMLNALGAVPYNIHGMEMSGRLLDNLAQFDSLQSLQHAKAANRLWLFADEYNRSNVNALPLNKQDVYPGMSIYRNSPLPREPRAQQQFQTVLTDWILDSAYKLN